MAVAYHVPVRDWPEGERPREKLSSLGPEQLSDAELLAILLGSGPVGQDVLSLSLGLLTTKGGVGGLSRMSVYEIINGAKGVGPAKAATLKAAFELGRRAIMAEGTERKEVRSAHDVANYLEARLRGLDQEHLYVVLLSTRNHILGTREVHKGNISSAIVRTSEVFKDAIRENAASIIVAHNHPSGDPTPSADDVRVTRELVKAGKLLSIELLDHVVIGDQDHGYVSLRERRLGFDGD